MQPALLLAAASLAATASARDDDTPTMPPLAPDPVAGDCLVASGRDAVAALANPACATLLVGVVSVHDADFPMHPVHRSTNVTIRPADPLAVGAWSALPRAALEASPLLKRTVVLTRGTTATIRDVSVAGAAAGGNPTTAIFSIFTVEHGAALVEVGCDLRARAHMCLPSPDHATGVAVDMATMRRATVGPMMLSHPPDAQGDVSGVSGIVDASMFYGGPRATPLPDGTPAPVIHMVNATLFCAGVPGDGGERRDARVLTSAEVTGALGATGSRTLLLTGALALPHAGRDAPGALVQNRAVVLRSTATDGGSGSGRVTLTVHGAHCVQPAAATGPGSSLALSQVNLVAESPGCASEPAVLCPLPGGARGAHFTPRGSLLPAGGVGVYSGGRLLLDSVDIAYVRCTREFEAAAESLARAEGAGATLSRGANGGVTLSCTHCAIDGCILPDAPSTVQPASILMHNTTLRYGGAAAARAAAALAAAAAAADPLHHASFPRARPSATVIITATLAVAGVAVLAGTVGAALGTRRARARVADATADTSARSRWSLFGRGDMRKVADDSAAAPAAAPEAGADGDAADGRV